jgi:hypothetical protein
LCSPGRDPSGVNRQQVQFEILAAQRGPLRECLLDRDAEGLLIKFDTNGEYDVHQHGIRLVLPPLSFGTVRVNGMAFTHSSPPVGRHGPPIADHKHELAANGLELAPHGHRYQ